MSQTEMFAHMRWHRAMHVAQSHARAQALCMRRRAMHAPRHYACGAEPCTRPGTMHAAQSHAKAKEPGMQQRSRN